MSEALKDKATHSFYEQIMSKPSEDDLYKNECNQHLWTLEMFCALAAGMTFEKYQTVLIGQSEEFSKQDFKRFKAAISIMKQLLTYALKNPSRDFQEKHPESAWKFIKWAALSETWVKEKFFSCIPITLKEFYREFQPLNSVLRTGLWHTRNYHEAFYLHRAQELLNRFPNMTPTQIYNDFSMIYVLQQIKELRGEYAKRTILESWLPKLYPEKRVKGRPKKV